MTERNIIIHWEKVPPEKIEQYPALKTPINKINSVIEGSANLVEVDASYSGPYSKDFDTIIIRRVNPEVAVEFVNQGDSVLLFGRRTTVCVEIAKQALERILGSDNVRVDPDGTFD